MMQTRLRGNALLAGICYTYGRHVVWNPGFVLIKFPAFVGAESLGRAVDVTRVPPTVQLQGLHVEDLRLVFIYNLELPLIRF